MTEHKCKLCGMIYTNEQLANTCCESIDEQKQYYVTMLNRNFEKRIANNIEENARSTEYARNTIQLDILFELKRIANALEKSNKQNSNRWHNA